MATITIPKKLIMNDDLIIMPRRQYEKFLSVFKNKTYTQLDRDLNKSIAEYETGKYFGPFETAKESIAFLKSHRTKKC